MKIQPPYHYLFGPVHSRRMGLSLGIDLVPAKTCSFNCPFCQVGATTCLTTRRRSYVSKRLVLAEFDDWLRRGGRADFITLAGSGEPTLHTGFGKILQAIGHRCGIRRALLSNGSLFHMPAVRRGAAAADLVKISLSAWDQASFERINRGAPSLDFSRVVDGLCRFRNEYDREIWLEVFVVKGINDSNMAMRRIAALAQTIRPDQVQLNTVVRPPAVDGVAGVSAQRLSSLARLFQPLRTQVIAHNPLVHTKVAVSKAIGSEKSVLDAIVRLVQRHPSTLADVAGGLGLSQKRAAVLLATLVRTGVVHLFKRQGQSIYR